jgi:P-type E1-E2 ATPase
MYLGNRQLMEESGLHFPPELGKAASEALAAGNSLSFVGWDSRVRGVFVFREELRPASGKAVTGCQEAGLDVAVLTGDHAARGRVLSEELGVPVLCELLPDDKVAAVRAAHERIGPVAMVGDGINDAPALAACDVGIALGCGADVTRDSASVCLLSDDPVRIVWAIQFARRTVRTIRRNLLWAFGYNAFGIALACTGWLNPAVAAFLMVVSSLLVVAGALRLGVDPEEQESIGEFRESHSTGTRAAADRLSIATAAVAGRSLIQPGGSGA